VSAVDLLERRPEDGAIEPLARVSVPVPGGPAVAVAADPRYQAYVATLIENGIAGPGGRRLFLADGEAFLEALPGAMRGSRLWAEPVSEETA
jgi:hypothetical protein